MGRGLLRKWTSKTPPDDEPLWSVPVQHNSLQFWAYSSNFARNVQELLVVLSLALGKYTKHFRNSQTDAAICLDFAHALQTVWCEQSGVEYEVRGVVKAKKKWETSDSSKLVLSINNGPRMFFYARVATAHKERELKAIIDDIDKGESGFFEPLSSSLSSSSMSLASTPSPSSSAASSAPSSAQSSNDVLVRDNAREPETGTYQPLPIQQRQEIEQAQGAATHSSPFDENPFCTPIPSSIAGDDNALSQSGGGRGRSDENGDNLTGSASAASSSSSSSAAAATAATATSATRSKPPPPLKPPPELEKKLEFA